MPIEPGAELDEKVARWMSDEYFGAAYSTNEGVLGLVLDEFIRRGYEPALVYDKKLKKWGLGLNGPRVVESWQPTRALAACAAVVALMESNNGKKKCIGESDA